LIFDAANWYDELDPMISESTFEFRVQEFLVMAGALKTYYGVMDQQGIVIDVTLESEFWNAAAAVMSADALKEWKAYSENVLDAVRVATGIIPPHSWSDASALPVLVTISSNSGMPTEAAMASVDRIIPLPQQKPVTLKLRTLMPRFPSAAALPHLPQAK